MRKYILFFAFCLLAAALQAQYKTSSYLYDAAAVPRDHPLDFIRMKLDLSLVPEQGLVKGRVTHYFTPLRPSVASFFLDGIQMKVSEIWLNGKPVGYHTDSAGITITPATPLVWNTTDSLTIQYEASPRRGLYFIGWNDKTNLSRKQVWSQGEGIDNRCWIPMYDERNDKLLTELNVTFDKDYKVLSNGTLKSKTLNSNGTITWDYAISHPQAPYLIMLGIGKYDIKETKSASGVPLHLYYYPEWKNRVEPTFQYSEAMFNFIEKETGLAFPWESYSQIPVQDYMFGAMENTTATIFGDFYMVDSRGILDRNYVAVNAHELAHQWFGDYVTARSDAHQWLQESFATYYNMNFEREVFGQDYFDWSRRGAQNASLDESTRNKFGVAHSEGGGTRIYGKGAFMLNMLKYVVGGREPYNHAIQYYLLKHPYQNVDTHDLLIAFEESTGMQLDWFWEEWFVRGGEPEYQVSLQDFGNTAQLLVQQTQELTPVTGYKNGLYKMPVNIEVAYTDGSTDTKQYMVEEQSQLIPFDLPAHKKIAYVLFDPGNEIMKSVHFYKPYTMLRAQAFKATNLLDRYDAVVAMRSTDIQQRRADLIQLFHQEKFYAIKNEVLSQLANDADASSIQLLKEGLADADPAVRKAALKYTNPNATLIMQVETLLTDSSYNIIESALQALLTDSSYDIIESSLQKLYDAHPEKAALYLAKTKNTEGNLGKNVLVKWLEISYYSTGKKQYADQLVSLTSTGYEFRTRVNAMNALKRCSYLNETLIANMIDAVLNPNNRLGGVAADILKYEVAVPKNKKAINSYVAGQQWLDWQKKILDAYNF